MNTQNGTTQLENKEQPNRLGPWTNQLPPKVMNDIIRYVETKNIINLQSSEKEDSLGVIASFSKNEPDGSNQPLNTPSGFEFLNANVIINENVSPESLKVDAYVALNIAEDSQPSINLYYDYALNNRGLPNLVIYIIYRNTGAEDNKEIIFNKFEIDFQSLNTHLLSLDSFKTVEVFLIEEDPKTSRGTLTTVTEPTTVIH